MADHVRAQIRAAAVAALADLPSTLDRVHASRLYPRDASQLPCLLVTTQAEDVRTIGQGPNASQQRTLELLVRGLALARTDSSDSLDDTLDRIGNEVEKAFADSTLGGLAHRVVLARSAMQLVDDLDKPAGEIGLLFQVIYHTHTTTPDIPG